MTDATELDYWRSELAGLEPLELPADRPRPSVREPGTARHTRTVPAATSDALRKAAAGYGAPLPVVLLAAYQLLLGRWSRRQDVAVGMPMSGELAIVRTDLAAAATFGDLVERAGAAVRGAQARPGVPFPELVSALVPEPDASHHPLVQALFAASDDGLPAPVGSCPPDLALVFADGGESEIEVYVDFSTALFDAATAERFAGNYLTLLAAVATHPGAALNALDILDDTDRRLLLTEWSARPAEFPAGRGVAELVAERARQTPDAVAVVFGDEEVTYRALNVRANRLAHHLRSLGVAPDVPVGVCLERGPELIVALLAVLKAGGAYVPLDPEHPVDRRDFVLRDTAAPVVVTQESLRGRLAGEGRVLVAVDSDTDREAVAARSDADPAPAAGPDDLAYVLYTSGSTGTPKGVAITLGSLVNLLFAMREIFPAPASDRVLFTTSATFDIANVEVFLPLITGGRIIGADREQVHTPRALAALVDRHDVTLVQATPSAWRPLLDAFDALGDRPEPRDLTVFTAGEALPADLAAKMLRAGRRVVNGYGPTETTIYATVAEIRDAAGPVPIGRPTPNTEVYVVDEADRPVPVGVPGELLIGGKGVARGYLGRSELTGERFTAHPFPAYAADGPEARVYRTGDLVRWLPGGNLEFLGRLDHQVKVRGFRIELGEIESALLTHADVASCVVTVREDVPGGVPGEKALVAYCVPVDGRTLSVGALRDWCGRGLPGYMVPGAFVLLDRLPLTTSGKTDRTALPAPDGERTGLDAEFVAPRTPAERAVARIWAEALWADEVGAHDDFFELGGDSLTATRTALRLQEEFGLEIPVRVLFACSTVETLAKALTTARRAGGFTAA
ncbi:amino acid adenylation domain-containing protein [Streptomyces sp. ISL-96]|uniref:non-ribosomal peptide synthetase n=1 Tax=Streptomyces sp. ISL-96 TaxID=2819191 RepID=UPI001BEB7144|nr:non-ribosomal peptide synthetase [Streptomyces sp. ISL-96]MBT2489149.1 amino acid adenylation domain-containing protein [Streptomyces sp. ISL-96]